MSEKERERDRVGKRKIKTQTGVERDIVGEREKDKNTDRNGERERETWWERER